MRCVSFILMILAVAGTSSVRGQQPAVREAIRDAAAAVLEERGPIREARREARRNVATIDKRGARNVGMIAKRRAAIWETTASCYALRLLAALRDGDFGDRQTVREERRDDRQEVRQERRDERQEARGDRGGDGELLRLALIAALRDGDFGDRQVGREERREDRQEAREERRDERQERAAIGEATASCYALLFLRRFATGILEIGSGQTGTSRGSTRGAPGTSR